MTASRALDADVAPAATGMAASVQPRRPHALVRGVTSPRGLTGVALVLIVVAVGLIGPLIISADPLHQSNDALAGLTPTHPLGTDEAGRDLLARLFAGIRVDLLLALVAVPVAAILGTFLGLAAASSRLAGGAIQGLFDVLLGFPAIVLGVSVGIAINPGFGEVVVTSVLVATPAFGRQVRVTAAGQLSRDYVSAARVLGTPRHTIITRHVLPNNLDTVQIRAATAVAQAIQIEGGLSVVGLGIQLPRPSLGSMISGGSQYLTSHPLYSLTPVVVVFVLIFGCTLLADALNKAVLR